MVEKKEVGRVHIVESLVTRMVENVENWGAITNGCTVLYFIVSWCGKVLVSWEERGGGSNPMDYWTYQHLFY